MSLLSAPFSETQPAPPGTMSSSHLGGRSRDLCPTWTGRILLSYRPQLLSALPRNNHYSNKQTSGPAETPKSQTLHPCSSGPKLQPLAAAMAVPSPFALPDGEVFSHPTHCLLLLVPLPGRHSFAWLGSSAIRKSTLGRHGRGAGKGLPAKCQLFVVSLVFLLGTQQNHMAGILSTWATPHSAKFPLSHRKNCTPRTQNVGFKTFGEDINIHDESRECSSMNS